MIGSFSRLIKKNKILVLIIMFLIIGILVFLLRSVSNYYLEKFENESKERDLRHWNVIRGFKFFKDLKECSYKLKNKKLASSLSDYLEKEEEKCEGGVTGIENACFKKWTPIEITDEKLEEQEEKLKKLTENIWNLIDSGSASTTTTTDSSTTTTTTDSSTTTTTTDSSTTTTDSSNTTTDSSNTTTDSSNTTTTTTDSVDNTQNDYSCAEVCKDTTCTDFPTRSDTTICKDCPTEGSDKTKCNSSKGCYLGGKRSVKYCNKKRSDGLSYVWEDED